MKFVKPKRKVDSVWIHCTASDRDTTVAAIRRWHTDAPPKGNGWSDIGYHHVIRRNGTIEPGRSLEKIPAAQKGHNNGSIAVVLNGNKWFTVEQIAALISYCQAIDDAYGRGIIEFHGHCEVANKLCPVINYKEILRLDEDACMTRAR